jgi:hypothetical protein
MRLLKKNTENQEVKIELNNGDTFTLIVRNPSFSELVSIVNLKPDDPKDEDQLCVLLAELVVGWKEVLDEEDKDVPFSKRNFEDFLCQSPLMIRGVFSRLWNFAYKLGEVDPKKSNPPSSEVLTAESSQTS